MLAVFQGAEPILYLREEESSGCRVEVCGEHQDDEGADQTAVSHLEEELAEDRACKEELEAEVSSVSGELA